MNAIADYTRAVDRTWSAERDLRDLTASRDDKRKAVEAFNAAAGRSGLGGADRALIDGMYAAADLTERPVNWTSNKGYLQLHAVMAQRNDPMMTMTVDKAVPPLMPLGWEKDVRPADASDYARVGHLLRGYGPGSDAGASHGLTLTDGQVRIAGDLPTPALATLWRAGYRVDMTTKDRGYLTVTHGPNVVKWRGRGFARWA